MKRIGDKEQNGITPCHIEGKVFAWASTMFKMHCIFCESKLPHDLGARHLSE